MAFFLAGAAVGGLAGYGLGAWMGHRWYYPPYPPYAAYPPYGYGAYYAPPMYQRYYYQRPYMWHPWYGYGY
jgi:hypothetical protein